MQIHPPEGLGHLVNISLSPDSQLQCHLLREAFPLFLCSPQPEQFLLKEIQHIPSLVHVQSVSSTRLQGSGGQGQSDSSLSHPVLSTRADSQEAQARFAERINNEQRILPPRPASPNAGHFHTHV